MGLYTLNRERIWFGDQLVDKTLETPNFVADDDEAKPYVESGLISPVEQEV